MILNGLEFESRTLYMYSEYFEDKPIDHLLGTPVIPERIDDNVLGRMETMRAYQNNGENFRKRQQHAGCFSVF
ncbi:hypothetical protein DB41_GF00060 [Neochlamydia sp. TUME1]|uniref:DUF4277 domain-containing protein n=1 Tax=Neochlamydia sp. TUME1 TaxID=1478174 RepID=UPI00057F9917|nr:hypothetical protein DB41_GF00060 [Neochlamydia sp. TUME1]